ncbi:Chitin biosynthesis protein CHS5 [Leucoagaricus sp. SymC.cos]|nr:Chitin biosynthesis protein CHS5 [Leucoagaricus sp. SymC.cos]
MSTSDSFTFTVGKLDAGMAILLGERAHLIEFPSILLPPGAATGSIVNISVTQNHAEEKRRDTEFWQLQEDILKEFGISSPEPPKLELRNVTQTSVTLEWPQIQLATAKLRSLDIYRNGQRLAAIPSPHTNTSTKLSGLELNTDYSFQLILRTTAGTFPSNVLRVRTHTMTDTSGICVCFGNVQDPLLLDNAKMALTEMNAKWSDKIQIDTTHFVCTTPAATPTGAQAAGNAGGAPGIEYQRALQLSIPVVQPHWILACHTERKMVPIAAYYLGAPNTPQLSSGFNRPQSMSQASLPQSPNSSSTKQHVNRASMPPPSRNAASSPPRQTSSNPPPTVRFEAPQEADETAAEEETHQRSPPVAASSPPANSSMDAHRRSSSMKRDFKFPSSSPPESDSPKLPDSEAQKSKGHVKAQESVISPSSIEVPPPPPVEKERSTSTVDDGEDEVGDTVEVPLN